MLKNNLDKKLDINKKIEEIRRKPEHIRIRYVWGLVAVSMVFILIIWIFSMKNSFQGRSSSDNSQDNVVIPAQPQNEAPARDNSNGLTGNDNSSPAEENMNQIPQDNAVAPIQPKNELPIPGNATSANEGFGNAAQGNANQSQ